MIPIEVIETIIVYAKLIMCLLEGFNIFMAISGHNSPCNIANHMQHAVVQFSFVCAE